MSLNKWTCIMQILFRLDVRLLALRMKTKDKKKTQQKTTKQYKYCVERRM